MPTSELAMAGIARLIALEAPDLRADLIMAIDSYAESCAYLTRRGLILPRSTVNQLWRLSELSQALAG